MPYSDKFKNLLLYILSNQNYKDEGVKKLNKIFYFVDFYFYRDHEKFISDNITYAKLGMGPVINDYKSIFSELINDGVINRINENGVELYKPLQNYDLSYFTTIEIDHINKILSELGKLSPQHLEAISHTEQPWVLTEHIGEIIDPDLALLIGVKGNDGISVIENENLKNELIELANAV